MNKPVLGAGVVPSPCFKHQEEGANAVTRAAMERAQAPSFDDSKGKPQ
jgi:hypothetical protein